MGSSFARVRRGWLYRICAVLIRIFVSLPASLNVFSCSLAELVAPQELFVLLPERPEAWKRIEGLSWELEWMDEKGLKRDRAVPEEGTVITVPRGARQAVVAYPVYRGCKLFPVAGIYPFGVEASGPRVERSGLVEFRLDYESGYAAIVVKFLEKLGVDPWVYPIHALNLAWKKKCRDPWIVRPEKAATELVHGNFGPSTFSGARRAAKKVELPISDSWLSENPFAAMEEEGGKTFAELGVGVHYFYSMGKKLGVRVDEDMNVSFALGPCLSSQGCFSG